MDLIIVLRNQGVLICLNRSLLLLLQFNLGSLCGERRKLLLSKKEHEKWDCVCLCVCGWRRGPVEVPEKRDLELEPMEQKDRNSSGKWRGFIASRLQRDVGEVIKGGRKRMRFDDIRATGENCRPQ